MDTPIHDSLLAEFRAEREAPKTPRSPVPTHPCVVCGQRQMMEPGSRGIGGALCMVCYYDL